MWFSVFNITCLLFLIMLRCSKILFFFKQKTAYEMRISDGSSDVCSSDLFSGNPRADEHDADAQRGLRHQVEPGVGALVLRQERKGEADEQPHQNDRRGIMVGEPCGGERGDGGDEDAGQLVAPAMRSEERRVGKGCVSTCRGRWWPD